MFTIPHCNISFTMKQRYKKTAAFVLAFAAVMPFVELSVVPCSVRYVQHLMNGGESDIFNLGNGVGYSVREVIETARKVTGHSIPAIETERRAGDPARLVASSKKAREILGWNPTHDSLEEIIASAWNWHKNHPNGYDA